MVSGCVAARKSIHPAAFLVVCSAAINVQRVSVDTAGSLGVSHVRFPSPRTSSRGLSKHSKKNMRMRIMQIAEALCDGQKKAGYKLDSKKQNAVKLHLGKDCSHVPFHAKEG